MNILMWIAQLILGGVFLFTGISKIIAYDKVRKFVEARTKGNTVSMNAGQAAVIGVAEVCGGVGEILPVQLAFPYLLPLVSSTFLAILMLGAFQYHLRRKESATPSAVLILLAVLVIIGRWPWWG
jgi:uncharacterized membrane protein YphA (DoxX/SURF4 family)